MCFTVFPSIIFFIFIFHEHFSRRSADKSFHVCKCFTFYALFSPHLPNHSYHSYTNNWVFFLLSIFLFSTLKLHARTMEYIQQKKVSICEDNVNILHCKTFSLKKCKTDRWSLTLSTLSLLLFAFLLLSYIYIYFPHHSFSLCFSHFSW